MAPSLFVRCRELPQVSLVRMYGFKLEGGGEWFKEGLRKLLSQE